MKIAADLCVYTNGELTIKKLESVPSSMSSINKNTSDL
jgi:hypothetical protein